MEIAAIGYENGKPFAEKFVGDTIERVEVEFKPYARGFARVISVLEEGDVLKAQQDNNPNVTVRF
ncbi:hypothetical protein K7I13_06830 [Brucepastera parasyntrophica]|uniref:hypothetical protein n=1 Tax=Brucepastera parasyntrophica TaxID=2880008 RepID=UPI0021098255|nr:hypothetical protein [Brucepastera parasyntrophica]ULQ60962.1 hypothetical protein K7I13_06830 [Brucepastera parasyntrophica]